MRPMIGMPSSARWRSTTPVCARRSVCDGRATTALATAFGSAAFGALSGVVLITLLASWVASVALQFGPAEYFAVYFLAFASFIGMGGARPSKTVVSLAIGFALAAVGIDTVSGNVRLTMGIDELVKGVSFVVAVMGLFGIGELLIAVEDEMKVKGVDSKVDWLEVFRTIVRLPRHGWALLRSAGCVTKPRSWAGCAGRRAWRSCWTRRVTPDPSRS